MLYSTTHSQSVARDLADDFSMRFKNSAGLNIVRQANDANGWPMIFLSHSASNVAPGNEAEGQPVIVLRLSNINTGSVDIFGNSTLPFTPTQCEIACELTAGIFTVSSANATAGAVYTSAAGQSFTVGSTIASGTSLSTNGIYNPSAPSGTLTKVSGTGDATITYSAFSGFYPFPAGSDYSTVVFQVSRTGMIVDLESIPNGTAVTEASMNAAFAAGPTQQIKDIDWGFKGNT